ncbi:MAG: hypothetical protein ABI036_06305, partial [Fibrobacteria bacterium]
MVNKNEGAPTAGASASARKPALPLRHLPATLASLFLLAILLFTGLPRSLEPWFFGLFLKAKGYPPVSVSTVIVSADPGASAMDAQTLSRLAAAILEKGPAVLAVGPAADGEADSLDPESLDSAEPLPRGQLVLSHTFSGLGPWAPADGPESYPPILAHSL